MVVTGEKMTLDNYWCGKKYMWIVQSDTEKRMTHSSVGLNSVL